MDSGTAERTAVPMGQPLLAFYAVVAAAGEVTVAAGAAEGGSPSAGAGACPPPVRARVELEQQRCSVACAALDAARRVIAPGLDDRVDILQLLLATGILSPPTDAIPVASAGAEAAAASAEAVAAPGAKPEHDARTILCGAAAEVEQALLQEEMYEMCDEEDDEEMMSDLELGDKGGGGGGGGGGKGRGRGRGRSRGRGHGHGRGRGRGRGPSDAPPSKRAKTSAS